MRVRPLRLISRCAAMSFIRIRPSGASAMVNRTSNEDVGMRSASMSSWSSRRRSCRCVARKPSQTARSVALKGRDSEVLAAVFDVGVFGAVATSPSLFLCMTLH